MRCSRSCKLYEESVWKLFLCIFLSRLSITFPYSTN